MTALSKAQQAAWEDIEERMKCIEEISAWRIMPQIEAIERLLKKHGLKDRKREVMTSIYNKCVSMKAYALAAELARKYKL